MRKIKFLQFSLAITLFFVFFLRINSVSAVTDDYVNDITGTSSFNLTSSAPIYLYLDISDVQNINQIKLKLKNQVANTYTLSLIDNIAWSTIYQSATSTSLNNQTMSVHTFDFDYAVATTTIGLKLSATSGSTDYLSYISFSGNNTVTFEKLIAQRIYGRSSTVFFPFILIPHYSFTGDDLTIECSLYGDCIDSDECPTCETCETCGEIDLYDPVAYGTEPDISIVYNKEYEFSGTSTIPDKTVYSYSYSPFIQYLYFFSLFSAVVLVIFVFKKLISKKQ